MVANSPNIDRPAKVGNGLSRRISDVDCIVGSNFVWIATVIGGIYNKTFVIITEVFGLIFNNN